METLGKFVTVVTVFLGSAITRGALIALYWNWFIRDEMFPGVVTLNVWLGIALGTFVAIFTFSLTDIREAQENSFARIIVASFLFYSMMAVYAIILRAILT